MLKRLVKKIWNDSVGSNVIATGIIGMFSIIVTLVLAETKNVNFRNALQIFWTYNLPLWIIAIIIIGYLIIQYIIKRVNAFFYDEGTLELDRAFFYRLRTILSEERMMPFKYYSFSGNPFLHEDINVIHELIEYSNRSDFEFINPSLDALKNELTNDIKNFQEVANKYIFGAGDDWLAIPREWEIQQPEKFSKAQADLIKAELMVSFRYNKLMKKARRVLKV